MEDYKIYIDTEKPNVKLKFRISYTQDRSNWATNEKIEPGYRVHATPVEVSLKDGYRTESFGAFTGFGDTLIPCERRSKTRYKNAKKVLMERMPKYIQWFKDKGHVVKEIPSEV